MFKRIITLFFCIILISCCFSLNVSAEECAHQEDPFAVLVLPKCNREGYRITYCRYCDEILQNITYPATGMHTYVDGACSECDKLLDIVDLVKAKEYLLDGAYFEPYDLDANNKLDASDVITIKKFLFANY